MLQPILSVEQMRQLDEFVIKRDDAAITLMQRAGEALADELEGFERIALVCGPGNNGGDGYATIYALQERGLLQNKHIDVLFTKEPKSDESKFFWERIKNDNVAFKKFADENPKFKSGTILQNADVIVDCLLGTGFSGVARGDIKDAIELINEAAGAAKVISMDINSGVNGDSGEGEIGVKSDITLSIGYLKTGMTKPSFKNWAKTVKNRNIGYELTCDNLEPFGEGEVEFLDV